MKIEMGESLCYSWLRHVQECQIVQTNWKRSPQWLLLHEDELEKVMVETDKFFLKNYGYKIYKQNASLSQLLQQAECDALGISVQDKNKKICAVDVAFHENGLNYGNREMTVMKIITKCLRTAMCIYGYLGTREAEIIFASPKINGCVLEDIEPCIEDMQKIMDNLGFHFRFSVIANDEFKEQILKPTLDASDEVADTAELFLRSYQMLQMFEGKSEMSPVTEQQREKDKIISSGDQKTYAELKIGMRVKIFMRPILESGSLSTEEISDLQNKEYSNRVLHLNFPLLVRQDREYDRIRYYKDPVTIAGVNYMLCSQWSESPTNNDRPYLEKWIEEHELKIGKRVNIFMRSILESGSVSVEEISNLQDKEYSNRVLHLNFPLLVRQDEEYDRVRYYKDPVTIAGVNYMLCSQWSESPTNNDRPYLEKWIEEHKAHN